jgi:ribonuclease PH
MLAHKLIFSVKLLRYAVCDTEYDTKQGDGGHLAACINAGALALATAGIALKDLVSACACALVPRPAGGVSDNGGAQTVCLADVCYSEEGAGSG